MPKKRKHAKKNAKRRDSVKVDPENPWSTLATVSLPSSNAISEDTELPVAPPNFDAFDVQLSELEALAAIYADDFIEVQSSRSGAKFTVRIMPTNDSGESFVAVDLNVTFCPKYPLRPPTLSLATVKGKDIADSKVKELQTLISKEARNQVGTEPMMYNIISLAQDFLTSHNVDNTKSGFELIRQRKEQDWLKQQKKLQAEKERQNAADREAENELSQQVAEELLIKEEFRKEKRRNRRLSLEKRFDFSNWGQDGSVDLDYSEWGSPSSQPTRPVVASNYLDGPDDVDEVDQKVSLQNTISTTQNNSNSRFESDFEVVCFLGRGGFASVVRAVNRMDGLDYAIKRIPLHHDERVNRKIMREVTLLSRLNHVCFSLFISNVLFNLFFCTKFHT